MTLAWGGLAALRFPHAAAPPEGDVTEVAPGVRWLRMPLPFALNHINLWLVDEAPGGRSSTPASTTSRPGNCGSACLPERSTAAK